MKGYIVTAPTEFLVFAETGVLVSREDSLDDALDMVSALAMPGTFLDAYDGQDWTTARPKPQVPA